MMVVERPLIEFVPNNQINPVEYLTNKLQLVRRYQNSYTVNLSYSIVLEGTPSFPQVQNHQSR